MALRRYSRDAKADDVALDTVCTDVMLDVARRLPQDDDVAMLAAEAVMRSPWNDRLTDRSHRAHTQRLASFAAAAMSILPETPSMHRRRRSLMPPALPPVTAVTTLKTL